ncbi:MAG: hypothetical protein ACFFD1_02780 [Candidatus Thorarchaeota archaeon]
MKPFFKFCIFFTFGIFLFFLGIYFGNQFDVMRVIEGISQGALGPNF